MLTYQIVNSHGAYDKNFDKNKTAARLADEYVIVPFTYHLLQRSPSGSSG
ncbi:MAG: hypothetical protein Q8941_23760 [Bacteroidota bacterium]|nr:hypothetical protein [Bacteroidota bacterium]